MQQMSLMSLKRHCYQQKREQKKWQEVKRQRKFFLLYFWILNKKVLGEEAASSIQFSIIQRRLLEITIEDTIGVFKEHHSERGLTDLVSSWWKVFVQPLQILYNWIKFYIWLIKEQYLLEISIDLIFDDRMVENIFVQMVINH